MKPNRSLLPVILGGVAAAMAAGYYLYATSRASVEIARYTVVRSSGDFEIRDFPALAVARTSMRGEDDSFLRLFRFIQRGNDRQENIPMTAPVFLDGGHTMSFVLPETMPVSAAPKPADEGVTLDQRPAARVAVYRYSGAASDANERAAREKLRAWVEAEGIRTEGDPSVAYYDSPMVPGFLKRNEVMLRIAE